MQAMSREQKLSAMFVKYLLKQSIRYQDDLVDQLFNSSDNAGASSFVDGAFRQRRSLGNVSPQTRSGDFGRNGRDNTVARQLLHEPNQKTRLYHHDSDGLRVYSSLLNVLLQDDDEISATAGNENSTSRSPSEAPPEPGGPADKDRAKRPRLLGFERRSG